MSLAKPLFVCGVYTVQPEHPSSWTVKPLVQISKNTTLDGTETRDLTWRKYQYELTWEYISNTEYDALETLFNYAIDSGLPISFTYGKFPQAVTAVNVLGEMGDREFKAGSGDTFYYSNVKITLIEQASRV